MSALTPGAAQPLTTPATQPAAAATPAQPAPPAPAATAAQLLPQVAAVYRRGVDGTHRVVVTLTPDEIGPVRLTVQLHHGQLDLALAGSSEAGRDALRAALPDLRRVLEDAGVTTGRLDVRSDLPGSGGQPSWAGASGFSDGRSDTSGRSSAPAWGSLGRQAQSEDSLVQGPSGRWSGGGRSLDLHV
ncbi:MAG: flagellar hook-length control protein FliK [Motilibacteraceae bacterium]